MSSWGQDSDVQSVDVDVVNSIDVSDGSSEGNRVIVSDNQWSSSVLPSSVSHLTLTGSQSLVLLNSGDVGINSISGEKSGDFLGLSDVVDFVSENQRQLWNSLDLVTSSENQWGNS